MDSSFFHPANKLSNVGSIPNLDVVVWVTSANCHRHLVLRPYIQGEMDGEKKKKKNE